MKTNIFLAMTIDDIAKVSRSGMFHKILEKVLLELSSKRVSCIQLSYTFICLHIALIMYKYIFSFDATTSSGKEGIVGTILDIFKLKWENKVPTRPKSHKKPKNSTRKNSRYINILVSQFIIL